MNEFMLKIKCYNWLFLSYSTTPIKTNITSQRVRWGQKEKECSIFVNEFQSLHNLGYCTQRFYNSLHYDT